MATDAAVMATSTFVGCVTGSLLWVHLAVLCAWSLMAGLLVAVGNRGAVLGTQAIIAVVVFGRFSQPPAAALGLAGLVLAGGCAQVLFLSVVRWPSPVRIQRGATAAAYRTLSGLAAGHGLDSSRRRSRSTRLRDSVLAEPVRRSGADDAAQPRERGPPDTRSAQRDRCAAQAATGRGRGRDRIDAAERVLGLAAMPGSGGARDRERQARRGRAPRAGRRTDCRGRRGR